MNALRTTTLLGALAAAFALSACDKSQDGRTAGEKLDAAVAGAERKTEQAGADIKRGVDEARTDIDKAVDKAGDKMKDASITTKLNAELARDTELSVLGINVDTVGGHVVLRGVAPSDAARARATTLAQRVEGVLTVDNQLTIGSRS